MANGCMICNFGDDEYCEFCPSKDTREPAPVSVRERIREWWKRATEKGE